MHSAQITSRRFILVAGLTSTAARRGRSIHARILQYLDELAPERADVLLDLVHVVLRDAFVFRLPLLHSHVSPYQISHNTLIPKVPLGCLLHFPLRQKTEIETLRCFRYKVHSM